MAKRELLQDKYDKLEKELNVIKEEIKKNEPLFEVDRKAMLSRNLFIVKIKTVKHHRFKENEYEVYYDVENKGNLCKPYIGYDYSFWVKESELEHIPFDRHDRVWKAYIDYYFKYNDLIDKLNNEVNIVCSGRRNK